MVELNINLFLRPEEVNDGDAVEFTDEGEVGKGKDKKTDKEYDTFAIGIKLPNGMERAWTMNATSQRLIAKELGTDTAKWMGRRVEVYKVKQNVLGELKDVIYVKQIVPQ